MDPTRVNDFEKAAGEQASSSFLGEFWEFLRHNKKWWLLPILVVLLLFGLLMLLSSSAAAPFIYTLF
jgi:drug/metabolite transporter superfamily protein YnfA